ncbi:hypothetical protein GCM10008931_42890 [Oceanobacillus oncorhynchi subsp. oncorhynchi]|uniref:hypothetical protein n=1 Tax=Oceanobacillus oncorhynchi TaxID=545501 RepID=UPI0031D59A31
MAENKPKVDLETDEYQRQMNSYSEFIDTFIQSFNADIYTSGIFTEVKPEDLKKYFQNPDDHVDILSDITQYFHISTGEIHMLFELIEALPDLSYKISSFDKPENHSKYVSEIHKVLRKQKHKILTRDVIKQTAADGTTCGIWLGDKRNLYPYIFDSPKYAFPSFRINGEWVVQFDLQYLRDKYKDLGREVFFRNLSPYITKSQYDKYNESLKESDRYVELPQERTFVINTHTMKRNQGLGVGWATSSLFDILHKKKLKNVEQSIANKIINAIAVLTIGSSDNDGKESWQALGKNLKRNIMSGVQGALTKSSEQGNVPVVGIPNFAKLEFPDVKADGLDGKKFDHINSDIETSTGLSGAVTHGSSNGNSASGKINLSVLYKRIGVLLEKIDSDMYQKMINLMLPKNQKDNYYLEHSKEEPLTLKEKVDILKGLNDKGWSTKHLVDLIDGIDFDEYLESTLYQTESLSLQERIKPFKSSFTSSNDDEGQGAPLKDDADLSEEGDATRNNGKNET